MVGAILRVIQTSAISTTITITKQDVRTIAELCHGERLCITSTGQLVRPSDPSTQQQPRPVPDESSACDTVDTDATLADVTRAKS